MRKLKGYVLYEKLGALMEGKYVTAYKDKQELSLAVEFEWKGLLLNVNLIGYNINKDMVISINGEQLVRYTKEKLPFAFKTKSNRDVALFTINEDKNIDNITSFMVIEDKAYATWININGDIKTGYFNLDNIIDDLNTGRREIIQEGLDYA